MSVVQSLYMLETYFETPYSAVDESYMLKTFDEDDICECLEKGLVKRRCVKSCHTKSPYFVYSLSEKGRRFCEQ